MFESNLTLKIITRDASVSGQEFGHDMGNMVELIAIAIRYLTKEMRTVWLSQRAQHAVACTYTIHTYVRSANHTNKG